MLELSHAAGLSHTLAAAAFPQEPRPDIRAVAVVELAFLNHGAVQVFDSVRARLDL